MKQHPEQSFNYAVLDTILAEQGAKPSSVIAILQAVQEHYRYLPQEIFPYMAEKIGISEAQIYSVATFYENFSLEPKGAYVIKICDAAACHVPEIPFPYWSGCAASLGFPRAKSQQMISALLWKPSPALGPAALPLFSR